MCQVVLPFLSVSLRDFYHSASTTMIQQENLKKRLARLAAPIFIETLLIMMLGAVDTVMLSRHSDNSVAAVGVVNQIIMLTFLVFEAARERYSQLMEQQPEVIKRAPLSHIASYLLMTPETLSRVRSGIL